MPEIDDLSDLVGAAQKAERRARAVDWSDPGQVRAERKKAERQLEQDRSAARATLRDGSPSRVWDERLATMTAPDRDPVGNGDPATDLADAEAAVAVARLALLEAQRAVLRARTVIPPDAALPPVAVVQQSKLVGGEVRREFGTVLTAKPRSILVKLVLTLAIGLGSLTLIRFFSWEQHVEQAPYLSLLVLSGVIGGVVCTNALSWDAKRVRTLLADGKPLWRLLVGKNITMFLLTGATGLVLSLYLTIRFGGSESLAAALGELATMMLVWLGVGNILSVTNPLRVEPLKARFQDGTLIPFLLSFVVSYGVGLGVNGVLTWKIWAKKSMVAELGGLWVPMLGLLLSAFVFYLLLTLLAVNLADRPRFRRSLSREVIDAKAAA